MKTYSPNIVDLSKELVNTILKNEIYRTNSTFLQGMGERKKVLFFLLDGLGSYQLESNEGVLLENRISDIYTTFPSTTNVVLSSFCTASMPREHGVLSYFMFDQDFGGIFNALVWNKANENMVKAENYLEIKTIWEILKENNVSPSVYQPKDLSTSILSKNIYRGAKTTTYENIENLFDTLIDNKETLSSFTFVYYPPIDLSGHVYGSSSNEYTQEIRTFETHFKKYLRELSKDFIIILTADHGMVDVEKENRIKVDSSNELIKIFGDNRSVFINGEIELAQKLFDSIPGEFIRTGEVDSLLGEGNKHPEYELRSPQHCFLPDEKFAVVPSHLNDSLTGYHGGITEKEMRIPLIIFD